MTMLGWLAIGLQATIVIILAHYTRVQARQIRRLLDILEEEFIS